VLTIHIDIGQLIAAVRRHVRLSRTVARAIREDWARLFDMSRVVAVSSASTRKANAAADRSPNRASKKMQ
jgi:hypothetical protein